MQFHHENWFWCLPIDLWIEGLRSRVTDCCQEATRLKEPGTKMVIRSALAGASRRAAFRKRKGQHTGLISPDRGEGHNWVCASWFSSVLHSGLAWWQRALFHWTHVATVTGGVRRCWAAWRRQRSDFTDVSPGPGDAEPQRAPAVKSVGRFILVPRTSQT